MSVAALVRPVLTFEEEDHAYYANGRRVDSVTQVLTQVWPEAWPWRNEFALERGRKVHQALHLWIMNDLDADSLSPYIAGYVASGIRWLMDSGFEIATHEGRPASEVRMYSLAYDTAGTADLFGACDAKATCADFKTGDPGWSCGPQTWMYGSMWQELTGEVIRQRLGVWLDGDGGEPKIITYPDHRNDQADFLAALRVLQRRRMLTS